MTFIANTAADMDATNRSSDESAGMSHGDQAMRKQVPNETIHRGGPRRTRSGNAAAAARYGATNPRSISMCQCAVSVRGG